MPVNERKLSSARRAKQSLPGNRKGCRPRLESLEERTVMTAGQWVGTFAGLTPGASLAEQEGYGRALLRGTGLQEQDVSIVRALDLSGAFVLQTPATVSLSTLTAELQPVPGFVYAYEYTTPTAADMMGSPNQGVQYLPPAQRSQNYFGPFDYDQYLTRERNGEFPDQGGPVDPGPADVLTNNDAGGTATGFFTQSETTVVAFGNSVVVGYNDSGSNAGGSNKFTGFSYSTDGGTTFTDGGTLPTNPGGDAGDPVLARNEATGRIYFATLGFSVNTIQVFHSDDNGVTWSAPAVGTPGGASEDKEWIAVDNFAGAGNGNVYLISRNFSTGNGIYLYRSTDHGATFGPTGGTLITTGSQGAYVTVGPDHAVYAFWYVGSTIQMRKSVDQGVTFSPAVTVATFQVAGGVNGDLGLTGIRNGTTVASGFRSNRFPHAAVNPVTGDIYVTYNDRPVAGTDKANIYVVQSTNGGTSWSAPVQVNDDGTNTDQWQPTLAVSPDGTKLGIFYYSRQDDTANNLFKYYGRIATISGATLTFDPGFAVSNTPSLPEFGRDAVINSVYMGDYNHAAATPGFFHVVWSDNRDDYTLGTPRKDPNAYYMRVPVSSGLRVTSTVPAVGSTVAVAPTTFTVNVSDPINPATLAAADFTVNGIPATDFAYTSGTTAVTFIYASTPVTTQGVQVMHVSDAAFARLSDDNPVGVFDGTFTYDSSVLAVISTAPAAGQAFTLPSPFTFDVTFNEPIDPLSVQTTDLQLAGIGGSFVSAVSVLAGNTTVRFTLAGITTEGTLTASIAAGAILDSFGNNGLVPFSASYPVDLATVPFPGGFTSKAPSGSRVYDARGTGIVSFVNDADSFTIDLDAGQTLSLIVTPTATGLQPRVELLDPFGTVIGTASAAAAGQPAGLQATPVGAGTYTVRVTGLANSTGGYGVLATLNAAFEAEGVTGGANDTAATAQSLDPAFTADVLPGAVRRAAVLGSGATTAWTDYYAVTAAAGDAVTVALKNLAGTGTSLFLEDGAGTVLATGGTGATNYDLGIANFAVSAAGVYYLRVAGGAASTYSLISVKNAAFDSEGNDTAATARPLGAGGVIGSVSNGTATTLTLNAIDSGWWSNAGNHTSTNKNYLAGFLAPGTTDRNFFVFSLAGIAQTVTSAQLRISNPLTGYSSPDPSETYEVFDVSTSLPQLRATGTGQTAIFDDLGTGVGYGAQTVSAANNGGFVTVDLNTASVTALNAALGGDFAFGGSLTTLAGTANQFVFGFTGAGTDTRQLIVGLGDPEDWYSVTLAAGQTTLNLLTGTPADGAGAFANTLDPKIDLYDETGTVLVASGVPLGDGRNESLQAAGLTPGATYKVRIQSQNGTTGEYSIGLAATADPPPSDLTVAPSSAAINENDTVTVAGSFTAGSSHTHTVVIDWGPNESSTTLSLAAGVLTFRASHQYRDDNPTGTASDAYPISVVVTDDLSRTVSASASVTVANVAPTVGAIGGANIDAIVRTRATRFTSTFADLAALDTHTVTWNFGDGTGDFGPTAASPGGVAMDHVYAAIGTYTVTLTVRDDDLGVTAVTRQVTVSRAALQDDPLATGQRMLVVGGTADNDQIQVERNGQTRYTVQISTGGGQWQGNFNGPISRVVIDAGAGNDQIAVDRAGAVAAWLYGGAGNDRISGGSGGGLFLGGGGDDRITGGSGRSVQIGGLGADTLVGGGDDDILIGGSTVHDGGEATLAAVLAEWTSGRGYLTRVANLRGLLDATSVLDDGTADRLTGGSGRDWFWIGLSDLITDRRNNELIG